MIGIAYSYAHRAKRDAVGRTPWRAFCRCVENAYKTAIPINPSTINSPTMQRMRFSSAVTGKGMGYFFAPALAVMDVGALG